MTIMNFMTWKWLSPKNLNGAIAPSFIDQLLSYFTVRCRMTYSTINFMKFSEILIYLAYTAKFPYMVISCQSINIHNHDSAYAYIASFCIFIVNIIVIGHEMTEIWGVKVLINYIRHDYIITDQVSCTKFPQHKHINLWFNMSYGFLHAPDKSWDISRANF